MYVGGGGWNSSELIMSPMVFDVSLKGLPYVVAVQPVGAVADFWSWHGRGVVREPA